MFTPKEQTKRLEEAEEASDAEESSTMCYIMFLVGLGVGLGFVFVVIFGLRIVSRYGELTAKPEVGISAMGREWAIQKTENGFCVLRIHTEFLSSSQFFSLSY